ncbi:MAG TPA: DUF5060 domain-containing protein, partial [Terriglobales bacterium]|nr:DUF5060 domain-containing protein [Terriglobales bacterium]
MSTFIKISKRSIVLVLATALYLAANALAQTPQAKQWGLYEVAFRSSVPHSNPFTDVELRCRFSSGDRHVDVFGFYDSDKTWKIRFMPEQQGNWTYTTSSNDAQLDGKSGAFFVGPPEPNNHGPIHVKGRHFAYADGTNYFPLGTTLYNWLNRDAELEARTLRTLAQNPFNKIRFLIFP